MNTLPQYYPSTTASHQHHSPDYQTARYSQEQSVTTRESLDAGITVQTSEGDLVTLSMNRFSDMEARMYNSHGEIITNSGMAAYSQNEREITLSSGERFSFTVAGDLNEAEFQDIETLLQGLDNVVTEMASGDLNGAMKEALDLEGFTTISSFTADLTYQRSATYSTSSTSTFSHLPKTENAAEDRWPANRTHDTFKAPERSPDHYDGAAPLDKFFSKLLQQLSRSNSRTRDIAREPVHQLFQHHQAKADAGNGNFQPAMMALKKGMEEIDALLLRSHSSTAGK